MNMFVLRVFDKCIEMHFQIIFVIFFQAKDIQPVFLNLICLFIFLALILSFR